MDNIKTLLGSRIKELRKQLGITQEQLAELINIDQRNLSNIECGVTFPSKSLLAIASAFNIPLTELFDFEHITKDNNSKKLYIQSALENMSEENITTIYRLIKSMT